MYTSALQGLHIYLFHVTDVFFFVLFCIFFFSRKVSLVCDLGWSSLCGQGCPRAHGNPPASALQVLILCEPFSLTSTVNFKEVKLLFSSQLTVLSFCCTICLLAFYNYVVQSQCEVNSYQCINLHPHIIPYMILPIS